jgi:hypothetical protein
MLSIHNNLQQSRAPVILHGGWPQKVNCPPRALIDKLIAHIPFKSEFAAVGRKVGQGATACLVGGAWLLIKPLLPLLRLYQRDAATR